jgi:hypothetical protein
MDGGDRQERRKAGAEALPTHDQTAILLLKPGTGPLGLETGHADLDGSTTRLLRLPDPFRDLCPDAPCAELRTKVFGIIPFISGNDLRTLPGASTPAGSEVDRVQQRHDLGAFIVICSRRAVRQRHAGRVRETVDEDSLTLPPRVTPSPPPLPGGKGAVHGPVLPVNHPVFLGDPQDAGLHGHERAVDLPSLQPPMRRTFGRPWGPTGEIAPAAAGDQHVEQGIHDLAKGRMGHPPAPPRWRRGKNVRKQLPFHVTQPVEASSHSALLQRKRGL